MDKKIKDTFWADIINALKTVPKPTAEVQLLVMQARALKQHYEISSPAVWELHSIIKSLNSVLPEERLTKALNDIELQYPNLKPIGE